jgi:hypothetical protein
MSKDLKNLSYEEIKERNNALLEQRLKKFDIKKIEEQSDRVPRKESIVNITTIEQYNNQNKLSTEE